MKLQIAQVIGLNTDQQAALVSSELREGESGFFALTQLVCDDAFTKGRQILSELADFYFDFDPPAGGAQKLTAAFAKGLESLPEGDRDLLLAATSGKIFYLLGQGQVNVYLKRERKLASLLTAGPQGQLISGFLQAGDKILLATRSLIDFLGEDLSKSLDLRSDLWEEEISSKVALAEDRQGLAGLLIQVDGEEEEAIPTLAQEETIAEKAKLPARALLGAVLSKLAGFLRFFPKSGRGKLVLAVILLLIIGLGAGFKYKTSQDQQKRLALAQNLQSARDEYNGAKSLASLNPQEAKNKLDASLDKVNQALSLDPKNEEAQGLKREIELESSSILQQEKVADFPLFLDLDLIKKDFKTQRMSFSAGKILVLDSLQYSLAIIDTAKKSNQILAGKSQLGEASLSSLNGNLAFAYSKDKGVVRTDTATQKQTQVAKVDGDWGEIKDLFGFAGNVYLLDTQKNQVWKYLPTTDGYSSKREYLTSNTKADFSSAVRMQIESSIYVLKSGGEILRFTKGEKDNFGYSGLPAGVKEPKSFFVSSDTDNLYLLDSGNARLLVLTKIGAYKGQYQSERFAQFSDLVVDEKAKKVYLLEGSKIYTMDLK